MNLFHILQRHKLLSDYIEFLDWIFTEKFDEARWSNKNRVKAFTNRIFKFEGLAESRRVCKPQKDIIFPANRGEMSAPMVYMSSGDSFGRDWVRHIRNGIAHGNCIVFFENGKFFIELKDYSDSSKKNQTAYMYIPIEYLQKTHQVYNELDRKWEKPPRKRKR